ncbi:hypothetical protein [Burkholderia ubonensis]|uniref:hypothetical protein n=1 Tax=Burkholderia ubonensis TaxID=101571 RepID=UPI000F5B570A|nr:hypothetical protein [Burkholderia ubonensis]
MREPPVSGNPSRSAASAGWSTKATAVMPRADGSLADVGGDAHATVEPPDPAGYRRHIRAVIG